MKLLFRQKLFSWFDSYDIYDEAGNIVYTVKGQLSLGNFSVIRVGGKQAPGGHCLNIYDISKKHVGTVLEKILTFLPKFEVYEYDQWNNCQYIGCISKEFALFKPKYNIDFNGWHVEGSWTEWDYSIMGADGSTIAQISKELLHMTDTYVLDVVNPADALHVLMFVLAVDAEKCSRN